CKHDFIFYFRPNTNSSLLAHSWLRKTDRNLMKDVTIQSKMTRPREDSDTDHQRTILKLSY
ncbi:MAG TPA: hypothetical protein VJ044_16580, partial [Candidatus Hodarchaeales archaeon]|nr:hypothetical protein [Candidatus Hodarchaeales archaeon]